MAISGDYFSPVTVNGFVCRNCSDVDRAKRYIDPADPAAGPFAMNGSRKANTASPARHFAAEARDAARLESLARERRAAPASPVAAAYSGAAAHTAGRLVDLSA